MSSSHLASCAPGSATQATTPTRSGRTFAQALFRLQAAIVARRQRRALLALDDRMLSDIGISRADAHREADRAFFDLPARHR